MPGRPSAGARPCQIRDAWWVCSVSDIALRSEPRLSCRAGVLGVSAMDDSQWMYEPPASPRAGKAVREQPAARGCLIRSGSCGAETKRGARSPRTTACCRCPRRYTRGIDRRAAPRRRVRDRLACWRASASRSASRPRYTLGIAVTGAASRLHRLNRRAGSRAAAPGAPEPLPGSRASAPGRRAEVVVEAGQVVVRQARVPWHSPLRPTP